MKHEMETGVIKGLYRGTCRQKTPTLGPKVFIYIYIYLSLSLSLSLSLPLFFFFFFFFFSLCYPLPEEEAGAMPHTGCGLGNEPWQAPMVTFTPGHEEEMQTRAPMQ